VEQRERVEGNWLKGALAFVIVGFIVNLVLFSLGYSRDATSLFLIVFGFVAAMVLLAVAYKRPMRPTSFRSMMRRYELAFIIGGACFAPAIAFFGGGLILLAVFTYSDIPRTTLGPIIFNDFLTFVYVSPIIGGILGYLIYKKSKYSKITYYDPFA
jgi:uncharacterized membrane protein